MSGSLGMGNTVLPDLAENHGGCATEVSAGGEKNRKTLETLIISNGCVAYLAVRCCPPPPAPPQMQNAPPVF
ncbi:hypothetical protein, partial [Brevirhabdus pacifica]|uniref:hypothetical protein n=1 Tax=Brevirhabdus pacifica TaxID=1267768 RepID=UPI001E4975AF